MSTHDEVVRWILNQYTIKGFPLDDVVSCTPMAEEEITEDWAVEDYENLLRCRTQLMSDIEEFEKKIQDRKTWLDLMDGMLKRRYDRR